MEVIMSFKKISLLFLMINGFVSLFAMEPHPLNSNANQATSYLDLLPKELLCELTKFTGFKHQPECAFWLNQDRVIHKNKIENAELEDWYIKTRNEIVYGHSSLKILDHKMRLEDKNGNEIITFAKPNLGRIKSAFVNSDISKTIITLDFSRNAYLWDLHSNICVAVLTHDNNVMSASFSSDGSSIITIGVNGAVSLWDFKGRCLIRFPSCLNELNTRCLETKAIVVNPDGDKIFGMVGYYELVAVDLEIPKYLASIDSKTALFLQYAYECHKNDMPLDLTKDDNKRIFESLPPRLQETILKSKNLVVKVKENWRKAATWALAFGIDLAAISYKL